MPIAPSKSDVQSGKVRTNIKPYSPESIIDTDTTVVNDVKMLSLVKLQECLSIRDKVTFQVEEKVQYRCLILTEEGYEQRVFDDLECTNQIGDTQPVMDYHGKQMQYILFYFIGSINNDPKADNPPFFKLSTINIALYNLDASNRLNLNMYATGTLIVTGDAEDLGSKTITVGGGGGIYLGQTGTANILQLQAGTALPEAMKADKESMIELGAKLSNPEVARTLGEAEINAAQDMASLSTATDNTEEAFIAAINDVILLQTGSEQEFELLLNRNFFPKKLTAQEITNLRELWLADGISKAVLDAALLSAEVIPNGTDLEEMNKDIEDESDMPNLDDAPTIAPVVEEQ